MMDISFKRKQVIREHAMDFDYIRMLIAEEKLDFKRDLHLIIELCKESLTLVFLLPREFLYEKEIIPVALRLGKEFEGTSLQYIEKQTMFSDKEWILQVFKFQIPEINDIIVSRLDKRLMSDKEWVMELIESQFSYRHYGEYIIDRITSQLSQKLKRDKELSAFIGRFIRLLPSGDPSSSIVNFNIAKYWVSQTPYLHRFIPQHLKDNRELALIALKGNGVALFGEWHRAPFFLPRTMKEDKSFVIEALKVNPDCIIDMEEVDKNRYLNDKQFILEAVKQRPKNIQLAHVSLRNDKKFILQLIEENVHVIQYLDTFNDDLEIAEKVVRKNGPLLRFFPENVRKNIEIVRMACRQNAKSIQFCLVVDEEIVMEVIRVDGTNLQFIEPSFKNQKHIVLEAVKMNGNALKYVDNLLFQFDIDIVHEALNNGYPYPSIHPQLRKIKSLALTALKYDSRPFKYIDDSLRNDEDIVQAHNNSSTYLVFNQEKTTLVPNYIKSKERK